MSGPGAKALYVAARRLADGGQPVFPCRSLHVSESQTAKAPLIKNGLNGASTDPEQIRAWWTRHRDAAVAIPTGIKWDVLDVDTKHGTDGQKHLPRLNQLGLLDGCQRLVRTPSGGWHLYFKASAGVTNRASSSLGLDVRGKGGYVLAPPSYIESPDSTGYYEDMGAPVGHNDDPLLWELIVSALVPVNAETREPVQLLPSERRASIAALREWVSIRQPGERNNALHWAVCRCIENGIDPHELVEAALYAGLSEEETLLTIRSAMKRAGVAGSDLMSEAEALFPDE